MNKIFNVDVFDGLKATPDQSVQCVVTSPPYWGLRDYKVNGQIGLEPTPGTYVEKMVEVFREVRRVLINDGVVWLNLGDTYTSGGRNTHGTRLGYKQETNQGSMAMQRGRPELPAGLKPKDLCGIPWRVAFALQADGWYLRRDIIWSKPNVMPESVKDRPTSAHEYIFLLTKSERYYYDGEAIRERRVTSENRPDGTYRHRNFDYDSKYDELPATAHSFGKQWKLCDSKPRVDKQRGHSRRHQGFNERWDLMEKKEQCANGRNARSVWEISPQPFPESHFATFPEAIPTLCIKAGSREGDLVLDPFMGAGTVAVVAKRLKRSYIGFELNPEYVAIAERRIAAEQEPLLVE